LPLSNIQANKYAIAIIPKQGKNTEQSTTIGVATILYICPKSLGPNSQRIITINRRIEIVVEIVLFMRIP
jgi:hypothetical protein